MTLASVLTLFNPAPGARDSECHPHTLDVDKQCAAIRRKRSNSDLLREFLSNL